MARRQDIVAPRDADNRETILEALAEQGCTCGDDVEITPRPLTEAENGRWANVEKRSGFDVAHLPSCPFIRGHGAEAN